MQISTIFGKLVNAIANNATINIIISRSADVSLISYDGKNIASSMGTPKDLSSFNQSACFISLLCL